MPNFNFTPFLEYAKAENIEILDGTIEKLEIYVNLLLEWNEKINLTAITEPEEIVTKHFIDSLSVLKFIDIKENTKLIDIGTGAGFPGMVLKILRPELDITLLDGHAKRFIFLEDLEKNIGVTTTKLHQRAELAGKEAIYRERFDYAIARAVASLNTLSEYCLPFVKQGGLFIAMKGPDGEEELKNAKNAISILGGAKEITNTITLPDESIRKIILIEKIKPINPKYPRASAKIKSKPL